MTPMTECSRPSCCRRRSLASRHGHRRLSRLARHCHGGLRRRSGDGRRRAAARHAAGVRARARGAGARRPGAAGRCASRPIRPTWRPPMSSGWRGTRRSTTRIAPTWRSSSREVTKLFPHLKDDALVLVSSQVPVGTTRELEAAFARASAGRARCRSPAVRRTCASARRSKCSRSPIAWSSACAPRVTRIGCGRCSRRSRANVEVVRVESAELTKHALNAFLATSVAFINEIARVAELRRRRYARGRARPEERYSHRPARLCQAGRRLRRRHAGARHRLSDRAWRGARAPDAISCAACGRATTGTATGSYDTVSRLLGVARRSGRSRCSGSPTSPAPTPFADPSAVELCRRLVAAGAQVVAHDPRVTVVARASSRSGIRAGRHRGGRAAGRRRRRHRHRVAGVPDADGRRDFAGDRATTAR